MATSSRAPQVVILSKGQVLGLLTELFAGFASDDFQQQLQELTKSNRANGANDLRCVEGRAALTLAVQRQVLPRYGFAGDEDGVLAMKMAVRKHMGDPRVARKSMDIRDKLLLPELRKEMPVKPEAPPQVQAPATPAQPALSAPAPEVRPAKEMEIKKVHDMEVMVQHAKGQGQLVVKVAAEGATMLQVKEAVVEALGRGTVAEVQLVMWGGGMFVNHRDCDEVMNDRIFATGLDLRGIN